MTKSRTKLQKKVIGLKTIDDWKMIENLIEKSTTEYLNNVDKYNRNLIISLFNAVYSYIPYSNIVIEKLIKKKKY